MIRAIPQQSTPATLPLTAIKLRPQIRTRNGLDETSLRELAESIKVHGILQPVLVAPTEDPDTFHLIAGERRILAASLAGLDEVPAMIHQGDPASLPAAQAVENLQREDLSPLDIAEGLRALESVYKRPGDLARALGKSAAWVSKHRRLARLKPAVLALVSEGLSDVETITTLDNLVSLPAATATPQTIALTMRALKLAEAGELTRGQAREFLAKAKACKAPDADPDADPGPDTTPTAGPDGGSESAAAGQATATITLRVDWLRLAVTCLRGQAKLYANPQTDPKPVEMRLIADTIEKQIREAQR